MNNKIFYFFYNLAHQSVFFDKLIVFLAVYFPYLVVLLAGIFLLNRNRKEIFKVVFSAAAAYAAAAILKNLFQFLRPSFTLSDIAPLFTKISFSFPSEHAVFFSALAFSIFFLNKKVGYTFMLFAFLIGLARVIAGVHFPGDILGGFILGSLVAYFVKKL